MKMNKLTFAVIVLIVLFLISTGLSYFFRDDGSSLFGNVALLHIEGPIVMGNNDGFSSDYAEAREIVSFLEDAESRDNVRAILLEINSPGGTAYASKHVVDKVKESDKYVICVIEEVGASGAYWIASTCDEVIAGELSVVGSIGVLGSYLEVAGLLDAYNVSYQRFVAGDYKDAGSPLKHLENDERELIQKQIDKIYDYFVEDVALNRNLSYDYVSNLATGEIFLGEEGKNLGLVDTIGNLDTAEDLLKNYLGVDEIEYLDYRRERSFFDLFSSLMAHQSFNVGRGIGKELVAENLIIRT